MIVAFLAIATVGVQGWTMGVVILASLAAGTRLRIGAQSTQQVAVSALLVMLLGSATDELSFAALRLLDTAIGTAVALTTNALFAPPSYLPSAQRAVGTLGREVAGVLDRQAADLRSGMDEPASIANLERARSVGTLLDKTEAAIEQARTSLKYHPFGGRERAKLAVIHQAGATLEHAAIQCRVISRAILDGTRVSAAEQAGWLEPDCMGEPLAAVLTAAAGAVRAFVEITEAGSPEQFGGAVRAVRERRTAAMIANQQLLKGRLSEGWVLTGEVLAVTGRLIDDLLAAATGAAPSDRS